MKMKNYNRIFIVVEDILKNNTNCRFDSTQAEHLNLIVVMKI